MDTYYVLMEKETRRVSIGWKVLHLLMLFLITITGFITAYLFGRGLKGFGNHCVLYSAIAFQKVEDMNQTIIPIDSAKTKWYDMNLCYFCQCVPLMSTIFAIIWIPIFVVCSRGGAGHSTDTYQRPYRIVYPALTISIVGTILMYVSSKHLYNGLSKFCHEFEFVFGTPECTTRIDEYTEYFSDKHIPCMTYLNISSTTTWLCFLFTFLHALILLLRILFIADFRMIQLVVTSKNKEQSGRQRFIKATELPSRKSKLELADENEANDQNLSDSSSFILSKSSHYIVRNEGSDFHLKLRRKKESNEKIISDLEESKEKIDDDILHEILEFSQVHKLRKPGSDVDIETEHSGKDITKKPKESYSKILKIETTPRSHRDEKTPVKATEKEKAPSKAVVSEEIKTKHLDKEKAPSKAVSSEEIETKHLDKDLTKELTKSPSKSKKIYTTSKETPGSLHEDTPSKPQDKKDKAVSKATSELEIQSKEKSETDITTQEPTKTPPRTPRKIDNKKQIHPTEETSAKSPDKGKILEKATSGAEVTSKRPGKDITKESKKIPPTKSEKINTTSQEPSSSHPVEETPTKTPQNKGFPIPPPSQVLQDLPANQSFRAVNSSMSRGKSGKKINPAIAGMWYSIYPDHQKKHHAWSRRRDSDESISSRTKSQKGDKTEHHYFVSTFHAPIFSRGSDLTSTNLEERFIEEDEKIDAKLLLFMQSDSVTQEPPSAASSLDLDTVSLTADLRTEIYLDSSIRDRTLPLTSQEATAPSNSESLNFAADIEGSSTTDINLQRSTSVQTPNTNEAHTSTRNETFEDLYQQQLHKYFPNEKSSK